MNTLKQSATSTENTFTRDECHKELKAFRHKLFDLQNMIYADGRFSLLIILQGPHGYPGQIF